MVDDADAFREQLVKAVSHYAAEYKDYVFRHLKSELPRDLDALPRVVLVPGIGAFCVGKSDDDASMVTDITEQALEVKQTIFETGGDLPRFARRPSVRHGISKLSTRQIK